MKERTQHESPFSAGPNYKKDKVLIAQRSGARVMETGNGLDAWAGMLNLKQTNLMYTSMGEKF